MDSWQTGVYDWITLRDCTLRSAFVNLHSVHPESFPSYLQIQKPGGPHRLASVSALLTRLTT